MIIKKIAFVVAVIIMGALIGFGSYQILNKIFSVKEESNDGYKKIELDDSVTTSFVGNNVDNQSIYKITNNRNIMVEIHCILTEKLINENSGDTKKPKETYYTVVIPPKEERYIISKTNIKDPDNIEAKLDISHVYELYDDVSDSITASYRKNDDDIIIEYTNNSNNFINVYSPLLYCYKNGTIQKCDTLTGFMIYPNSKQYEKIQTKKLFWDDYEFDSYKVFVDNADIEEIDASIYGFLDTYKKMKIEYFDDSNIVKLINESNDIFMANEASITFFDSDKNYIYTEDFHYFHRMILDNSLGYAKLSDKAMNYLRNDYEYLLSFSLNTDRLSNIDEYKKIIQNIKVESKTDDNTLRVNLFTEDEILLPELYVVFFDKEQKPVYIHCFDYDDTFKNILCTDYKIDNYYYYVLDISNMDFEYDNYKVFVSSVYITDAYKDKSLKIKLEKVCQNESGEILYKSDELVDSYIYTLGDSYQTVLAFSGDNIEKKKMKIFISQNGTFFVSNEELDEIIGNKFSTSKTYDLDRIIIKDNKKVVNRTGKTLSSLKLLLLEKEKDGNSYFETIEINDIDDLEEVNINDVKNNENDVIAAYIIY